MMDMPLPEPTAYQYLFESYYGPVWRNDSRDWNGSKPIKTRTLHSADHIRARDAQWRDIVAAAVAKERERCAKVCEGIWPEMHKYWGPGQARAACEDCAAAIRGA